MVIKSPIIGVDFGQTVDPSAICFGMYGGEIDIPSEDKTKPSKKEPILHLKYLERLELGIRYEDQICQLKKVYDKVKEQTGKTPVLIVDATGVGKAVTEMVRKAGMYPISVTVTGGNGVTKEGRDWKVSKKELVSPIIVGIQNGTVQIAKSLEHADLVKKEMAAFKLKINIATGNESFEAWRQKDHDDLVFACALVAYAFFNASESGVIAWSKIPSKYNDGMVNNWNKYR